MEGRAHVPAFLEDCAAMAAATADLYEATFDPRWLSEGTRLAELLLRDFADPAGGFFSVRAGQPDLIVRAKNAQDGSSPSGTSLAAWALLRLGRLTGRADLEEVAEGTLRAYQRLLEEAPGAFHQMLIAVDLFAGPRREIVIAGPADAEETKALVRVVRSMFLPRAMLLWTKGDGERAGAVSALLEGKTMVGGRPAAYVCRDQVCDAPLTEPAALEAALRA
jgi:uncharacterized protein YyaL (SSP411 family)